MKEKFYVHQSVRYGYSVKYRKWQFQLENSEFITPVKGGKETAHKIARILHGSFTRSGRVDNLARANIRTINS